MCCKSMSKTRPLHLQQQDGEGNGVKVEGDTAMLKAAGWDKERAFPTKGKYACACGESCNCGTISQNPGKCACGNDMKKVQ